MWNNAKIVLSYETRDRKIDEIDFGHCDHLEKDEVNFS